MSDKLGTTPDIKIPYPIEGVIRTAQLDDTVTPEGSVQLAVNMNFDRIGAMQTRLGVTSYADSLANQINNFGTLRNSIVPLGNSRVAQMGAIKDIVNTQYREASIVEISDTRIAIFWTGVDSDGFAQQFEIDRNSGDISPVGTAIEFDSSNATGSTAILINSLYVMNVWTGPSGDGFVQCFLITGDDLLAVGSPLEFDTSDGTKFSLAMVNSDHIICFYQGSTQDGIATIFAMDGSGNVTEPGSPLTFESSAALLNTCASIGNGTHFVNFWATGSAAKAQCFSVNTSTWAITAIGSALTFDTNGLFSSCVAVGDGTHFINFYQDSSLQMTAQVFLVNASTFAVTTVGTPVIYTTDAVNCNAAVGIGDGIGFIAFYAKNNQPNGSGGYVQLFHMNASTFVMSLQGASISGYPFYGYVTAITLENYKVIASWNISSLASGEAVMFETLGAVVNGQWLYAGYSDKIANLSGTTWTVRRSGLAQVSKPRFSQYLNYIWMVNGNEFIGGDPVATSNGGSFGTDLVPDFFPAGDFIHAGFEGRVWVADKTLGIIYYTDIVQFVPPIYYSFTFNRDVNFISTIAPQTGQTFTALYRVPRALLVFTEDNIYRIYGATSIDAYPAYFVGTFSQESIVETKTGIFFHHSSGFYQFDYGSQPVEISRRVIDFVKAIPRSYYPDVTGVYDGYDAIEWSVGQVTVEGVVFANCVMRFTISTQVWTIYDYPGNVITAMIYYDDGTTINHLMGTSAGKTGAMDSGYTDFGQSFYYEFIDRWRSYTLMYCNIKSISGFNVYSENAAGANLMYQVQKAGPNAWTPIGTVTDQNNALMPNSSTEDFDVARLRIAGNTSGAQVVIHGIEITQLTVKGYNQN